MTQTSPMEPFYQPGEAAADYRQQARDFLSKSRQYLAEDDLHQAAEKGWGAAAWMAKAVAETQGWQYCTHDQFREVMYRAQQLSGDNRVAELQALANDLHGMFYTRKRFLHADMIASQLDRMGTLLDILQPLTGNAPSP